LDEDVGGLADSGARKAGIVRRQYIGRRVVEDPAKQRVLRRNLVVDAGDVGVVAVQVAGVREEESEVTGQSAGAPLVRRRYILGQHLEGGGVQPARRDDIAREWAAGGWILDGDRLAQREELGEIPLA